MGAGFTPCVVATDPDLDPLTFSIVSTVTYTGLVNITSAGTCCALASWGWGWWGVCFWDFFFFVCVCVCVCVWGGGGDLPVWWYW